MEGRSEYLFSELASDEMCSSHKEEEIEDEDEIENGTWESEQQRVPHWTKQITMRGVIASTAIGVMYSIIVMKLNVTTGVVPNLNVSAALLAFVFVKSWTKVLHKAGFAGTPFTKQENTIIQTCAVACYSIAIGGGFGSYLLGLNRKTYQLSGVDTPGNRIEATREPSFGWMTGFLVVSCFVGLLALVPLRKIMIIDYKLKYPSGTATAQLINNFHTPNGDSAARKQVEAFLKFFSFSFGWAAFQWFFAGGESCGFVQFPTFGLLAWKHTFYFDFSATYVGTGMICSHLVNLSCLFGAVISWGIMWPLIGSRKGTWYPAALPESSMKSLNGYKAFITIALLLGDGLYNFAKIMIVTASSVAGRHKRKGSKTGARTETLNEVADELRQNEVFIRESIPIWAASLGYAVFAAVSIIVVPLLFPELKWYYVVVAYVIAPSLSFCNAYGAGLTDMNMAYNYGKVALFIMAALSGKENGVVAGLIGCGLIKMIVSISSDLMQDMKTGHLTMTSARTMVVSQAIGTAIGCVVAPASFFVFYKAFDVGNPEGEYKAPYALIYRNMAILGVEGFGSLPRYCGELCVGFFAFAVGVNLVRDMGPGWVRGLMPLPVAMAMPFLVGAYFAVDMAVGSAVVWFWGKRDRAQADMMVPAVASGLICGDGLWILPSALLAFINARPPLCMAFFKGK